MYNSNEIKELLKTAIPLAPNNYTPLSKTPWAGFNIAKNYKSHLNYGSLPSRIGESWEFSCDPSLPSLIKNQQIDLPYLMEKYQSEIYSEHLNSKNHTTKGEFLLKLLDTSEPLSFQLHPDDHDPHLHDSECGKPESWLILNAQHGAGVYLGFKENVKKEDIKHAILENLDLSHFMQFVPVHPLDYFDIPPGTPHAIGSGVTLLEPQRTLPNKSGKTYRLWDWNRAYDNSGNYDLVHGLPRELHVEASMKHIEPDKQAGREFLNSLKPKKSIRNFKSGIEIIGFERNLYYHTEVINFEEASSIKCGFQYGYSVVFTIEGQLSITSKFEKTILAPKGQCFLLPFNGNPYQLSSSQSSRVAVFSPDLTIKTWEDI